MDLAHEEESEALQEEAPTATASSLTNHLMTGRRKEKTMRRTAAEKMRRGKGDTEEQSTKTRMRRMSLRTESSTQASSQPKLIRMASSWGRRMRTRTTEQRLGRVSNDSFYNRLVASVL